MYLQTGIDISYQWKNLDMENLPKKFNRKWLDRKTIMTRHWKILNKHVPEYCVPGKCKILDAACGSGSMLEILRGYGHNVQGLELNEIYFPLLYSQEIPFTKHDCTEIPYPSLGNDLVICWGAFTFFPLDKWISVLDEMARIGNRTILIGINRGPELDQMMNAVTAWSNPKFKMVFQKDYIWKWEAV